MCSSINIYTLFHSLPFFFLRYIKSINPIIKFILQEDFGPSSNHTVRIQYFLTTSPEQGSSFSILAGMKSKYDGERKEDYSFGEFTLRSYLPESRGVEIDSPEMRDRLTWDSDISVDPSDNDDLPSICSGEDRSKVLLHTDSDEKDISFEIDEDDKFLPVSSFKDGAGEFTGVETTAPDECLLEPFKFQDSSLPTKHSSTELKAPWLDEDVISLTLDGPDEQSPICETISELSLTENSDGDLSVYSFKDVFDCEDSDDDLSFCDSMEHVSTPSSDDQTEHDGEDGSYSRDDAEYHMRPPSPEPCESTEETSQSGLHGMEDPSASTPEDHEKNVEMDDKEVELNSNDPSYDWEGATTSTPDEDLDSKDDVDPIEEPCSPDSSDSPEAALESNTIEAESGEAVQEAERDREMENHGEPLENTIYSKQLGQYRDPASWASYMRSRRAVYRTDPSWLRRQADISKVNRLIYVLL